jgi:serine/threonine protein kinase
MLGRRDMSREQHPTPQPYAGVTDDPSVVLDRYRIESLLGSGAFGAVYRGQSIRSHAVVAVKIEHITSATQRPRFEREAALLARINNANVVAVLDFGHLSDGAAVVVMEFVDGVSLEKYIAQHGGWIPWREAVNLALGLLDGLDAAHEAGVLHRDVKPQNILIQRGEVPVVKLVDFGIARDSNDRLAKLTGTGQMLGSLGYMAPEQLATDPVDVRCDVYAAGVVLYEMLSGTTPFTGAGLKLAMNKLASPGPTAIALPEAAKPWPEQLTALVLSMLRSNPNERPATAYDAAQELRVILRKTISRPSHA